MKRFHPSPALVVSLIALFVALGGTSYAAINALPKNSVGTKQIKNGAVTPTKLNAAVSASFAKYGQTLPHGKTEKGEFGFGARAASESFGNISFPIPLASPPTLLVVPNGGPNPPGCTGDVSNPGAAAGKLCIFAGYSEGGLSLKSAWEPVSGGHSGFTLGVTLWANSGGSGNNNVSGTWAVTAP